MIVMQSVENISQFLYWLNILHTVGLQQSLIT